jgi:hypothetical protein
MKADIYFIGGKGCVGGVILVRNATRPESFDVFPGKRVEYVPFISIELINGQRALNGLDYDQAIKEINRCGYFVFKVNLSMTESVYNKHGEKIQ